MNWQMFSAELKDVFLNSVENISSKYGHKKENTEVLLLSFLTTKQCKAYTALSGIIGDTPIHQLQETLKMSLMGDCELSGGSLNAEEEFSTVMNGLSQIMAVYGIRKLNSDLLLIHIVANNKYYLEPFSIVGLTKDKITTYLRKNYSPKQKGKMPEQLRANQMTIVNYLTSITELAKQHKVDSVVGCESLYNQLLVTFSKFRNNSVVVYGKSGVGKTSIVKNLANLDLDKTSVFEVRLKQMFIGATMRGIFEERVESVLNIIRNYPQSIFFIDDVDILLLNNNLTNDVSYFIDRLLKENTHIILTTSDTNLNKFFETNPQWKTKFETYEVKEPEDNMCIDILKLHSARICPYHNISVADEGLCEILRLSKKLFSDKALPLTAIDLLDSVGAKLSQFNKDNDEIRNLKSRYDELTKKSKKTKEDEEEEIRLKNDLDNAVKEFNLSKKVQEVKIDDIRKVASEKSGINIEELSVNDLTKLRDLDKNIKSFVVGQDEAVDSVCLAVKRQRVGIANPNKPLVFLFCGSTGVGKTYLAKILAKEVFGTEKKVVRLDMAEYADKTSVNKLLGSSAGYIGYTDGGILTEIIKREKQCVLLLDEIEKANSEVHNTFLSMFDEGRLTDNKGVLVDFRNVIIIMTSNLGAKEVEERGGGLGFVKNDDSFNNSIIKRSLKNKFAPEFINRINKIVYFNNLNEEQLGDIIKIEFNKLANRLSEVGYQISNETLNKCFYEIVYENSIKQKSMGARPILREIENVVENKIVDLIVNNECQDDKNIDKMLLENIK